MTGRKRWNMVYETKRWRVKYSHSDGRSGTVEAVTEISKSGSFTYGNGKGGALIINDYPNVYDLRYNREHDLHMVMLKDYFGKGLVEATELK